ncbi:Na+/H+ antiporter subunit C [Carnimonas nigrificans]|uniref:Na+/H+ antiporter subunit C n=1 Tax=Carnimonas nigrificans TaxID=64323 RepID=UPI0004716D16|nr:Na+/H+ antiporter subunit C [Carnimonas nigrificans]
MEAIFSATIGILTACGIFMMLRGRTLPIVLGMSLMTFATNLFLFSMGRLRIGADGLVGSKLGSIDPVPSALVLTAIVIGFAMTAFVMILAIRARADLGSDHINGSRRKSRHDHRSDPLELDESRGGKR